MTNWEKRSDLAKNRGNCENNFKKVWIRHFYFFPHFVIVLCVFNCLSTANCPEAYEWWKQRNLELKQFRRVLFIVLIINQNVCNFKKKDFNTQSNVVHCSSHSVLRLQNAMKVHGGATFRASPL